MEEKGKRKIQIKFFIVEPRKWTISEWKQDYGPWHFCPSFHSHCSYIRQLHFTWRGYPESQGLVLSPLVPHIESIIGLKLWVRLCKGNILNITQTNVCLSFPFPTPIWEPSKCLVVAVLQSGWSSLPTRWDFWSTARSFARSTSEASSSWAACWKSSPNPASATFKVMYSIVLAQRHFGGV